MNWLESSEKSSPSTLSASGRGPRLNAALQSNPCPSRWHYSVQSSLLKKKKKKNSEILLKKKKKVRWPIGLDKGGYHVNIFLISPWKHMLWVFIRGASNEYPQHMFSWRHKENIDTFWLKKASYLKLCKVSKLYIKYTSIGKFLRKKIERQCIKLEFWIQKNMSVMYYSGLGLGFYFCIQRPILPSLTTMVLKK